MQSYIAVPLRRPDGSLFGTLCALDDRPAELSEEHVDLFVLLANLITLQLEQADWQRKAVADLESQRSEASIRERLIAILGHDLGTPLRAATRAAEELLVEQPVAGPARQNLISLLASVRRASRMVTELLDFARARLGGGIPIRRTDVHLDRVLEKVVAEIRACAPRAVLVVETTGDCQALADADRSAQAMANLITNALEHGTDGEVRISLAATADAVVLEVMNRAALLTAREAAELFSPLRPYNPASGSGLGLGLSIVEQIVRAHGGSVAAAKDRDSLVVRASWPRTRSVSSSRSGRT